MTRFTDGPAAGVTLMLRRAPLFLRVVQDHKGKWDALDQLQDEPRLGETVTVYRKVRNRGSMHLRPGGFFQLADYAVVADQPPRPVTWSQSRWRSWCEAEVERRTAEPKESSNAAE